MKKILIATTALVATAGAAAADISVSGDGRMGFVYDGDDVTLSSRIRIGFSASGETDGGLAFGGSVRADNSGSGSAGSAGSVFISGAFGKLSMGDVDGAAKAAVGQVSGVGYTGNGDFNEITYVNSGSDVDGDDTDNTIYPVPSALYEYNADAITFYAGIGQIGGASAYGDAGNGISAGQSYSVGVKWANDNGLTLRAGYESTDDVVITTGDGATVTPYGTISNIALGADWTNGSLTLKGRYAMGDFGAAGDVDQYAFSVDYAFDATTVTAFYRGTDFKAAGVGNVSAYGIGAAHDLGGGATFAGGWSRLEASNGVSADRADLGIKFSF